MKIDGKMLKPLVICLCATAAAVIVAVIILQMISLHEKTAAINNLKDIVDETQENLTNVRDDYNKVKEETKDWTALSDKQKQDFVEEQKRNESEQELRDKAAQIGMSVYFDEKNGYHCFYPSELSSVSHDGYGMCAASRTRIRDRESRMYISCERYNTTPAQYVAENYDVYYTDYDYKAINKNDYAIRVYQAYDDFYRYEYGYMKKGAIYSFCIEFPREEFNKYDKMINQIYADFKKQF